MIPRPYGVGGVPPGWLRWWLVLVALGITIRYLAGCTVPTAPTLPDAGGFYAVFLRLDGRERPSGGAWLPLRCEGGISMVLDDLDGTLNGGFTKGTLACWFGAEVNPRAVEWASPIEGERRDQALDFDDGSCRYQGRLTGPHSAEGTLTCTRDSGSTELDLTGDWSATK